MKAKTAQESRTIQASLVQPSDTNYHGTIFGGTMMSYIDEVAAIAAMRHSRRPVVTASIDSIDFLAPVKMGNSICLEAFVSSTGKTSMEIFVKVVSENLRTGERVLTATSFLTFVALDEEGNPTEVPALIPETEEEKYLMASAEERKKMRAERKNQTKEFVKQLSIEKTI
mgnify:CR=1 FL=1|jgi:acyl-CoA hydrolase